MCTPSPLGNLSLKIVGAQHIVNPAGLSSSTKYIIAFYLLGASKAQRENEEGLIYCGLLRFLDYVPTSIFSGNEIIAR